MTPVELYRTYSDDLYYIQTYQLSRFSRESPSFSSNLLVSRLEHQISWELPTVALVNFFFINFVIFEMSGTFGRPSGDCRRVFRHCRKLYSYNAKISSRLQVLYSGGWLRYVYTYWDLHVLTEKMWNKFSFSSPSSRESRKTGLNQATYGSLRPFPTSRKHGKPQNSRIKIYFSNRHS